MENKRKWYELIDNTITAEQLEELSSYFIKILDSCPTRLKKRLAAGPVILKDGKVFANNESLSIAIEKSNGASSSWPSVTTVQKTADKNNEGASKNEHSKSNLSSKDDSTRPYHQRRDDISHQYQLTDILKAHSHEATPPPQSWPNTLKRTHSSTMKFNQSVAPPGVTEKRPTVNSSSTKLYDKHRKDVFHQKKTKVTREVYEAMTKEQKEKYREIYEKHKRAKEMQEEKAAHALKMQAEKIKLERSLSCEVIKKTTDVHREPTLMSSSGQHMNPLPGFTTAGSLSGHSTSSTCSPAKRGRMEVAPMSLTSNQTLRPKEVETRSLAPDFSLSPHNQQPSHSTSGHFNRPSAQHKRPPPKSSPPPLPSVHR